MKDSVQLQLAGEEIDVRAVRDALDAVLTALRSAAEARGLSPQPWTVNEIRMGSVCAVLAQPGGGPVVDELRAGVSYVERTASMPPGWSNPGVRALHDLAKLDGKRGVTSVTLAEKELGAPFAAQAKLATDGAEIARGTVTGVLDKWDGREGHKLGVRLDTGEAVSATYPAELDEQVRSCLTARCELTGTIRRDPLGKVATMNILSIEPLPQQEAPLSSAAVRGLFSDCLTLESWLAERG